MSYWLVCFYVCIHIISPASSLLLVSYKNIKLTHKRTFVIITISIYLSFFPLFYSTLQLW